MECLSNVLEKSKYQEFKHIDLEQFLFEIVLRIFDLIDKNEELSDDEIFNGNIKTKSFVSKMFDISLDAYYSSKLSQDLDWFSNTLIMPINEFYDCIAYASAGVPDDIFMKYLARYLIKGSTSKDLEDSDFLFTSINQTYLTFKVKYSELKPGSDRNEDEILSAWILVYESFNTNIFSGLDIHNQSKIANLVTLGVRNAKGKYRTLVKCDQEWHLISCNLKQSGTLQDLIKVVRDDGMYPTMLVYEIDENSRKRADSTYIDLCQNMLKNKDNNQIKISISPSRERKPVKAKVHSDLNKLLSPLPDYQKDKIQSGYTDSNCSNDNLLKLPENSNVLSNSSFHPDEDSMNAVNNPKSKSLVSTPRITQS